MSSQACSYGLNLVEADTVILYDLSKNLLLYIGWNPYSDIQAIARSYRQGQTKEVTIYRLISQETIEEVIYRRSLIKLSLSLNIYRETTVVVKIRCRL